jgi:hypothetical protein
MNAVALAKVRPSASPMIIEATEPAVSPSVTSSLFTANEIALSLGKSKRAVQLALCDTRADGQRTIRGQLADAWSINSLPPRYVEEIERIRVKKRYRTREDVLRDPPKRFLPRDANGREVPLSDVSESCIARALRKMFVLTPALQQVCRDGRCDDSALRYYRSEFGNVSERHFRRLVTRTIKRDAGEERFDDPILYLDEVVARKRSALSIPHNSAERMLLDTVNRVKNPSQPSLNESALTWTVCFEVFERICAEGRPKGKARRRVLHLLAQSGVALARSTEALRQNFKRKYQRWLNNGRTFAALEDQRLIKSGNYRAPKLPEPARLKLIGHAVLQCQGNVTKAIRDKLESGELGREVTRHYLTNPASKSYVPLALRKALTGDVRRLDAYHHGPREHKLRGAYHTRDWSGVAAGDWFQSDDLTAPVYFYKQTDLGPELTRGQFLPMIDERTTKILGFVLIQRKNYNSLDIRSLITLVCSEHGLPRRGFSFERGIWQSSKILTGTRGVDLQGEADTGLRRLGMRFRHADFPRGKVIERTLGQLQDLMGGLPGYCGRNEKLERFERFQRAKLDIEARRVPPEDHLLSAEEICLAFEKIVDRYNAETQQGRKLDGRSPNVGWTELQGTEPRIRCQSELFYFLASDVRRRKIGRNGITIRIGKNAFNYKNLETGRRQGEIVHAWFNSLRPETLPCTTDLLGRGLFVVERSYDLSAVDASPEELEAENSRVAAHNSYAPALYHVVKNSLQPRAFRPLLESRAAVQLGTKIESQQDAADGRHQAEQRLRNAIVRRSKRAGISPMLVPVSSDSLESLDEFEKAQAALELKAAEDG